MACVWQAGAQQASAQTPASAARTVDDAASAASALAPGASATPVAVPTASPFGDPLSSTALAKLRGGADTTVNDMQLNGTTANNTARNVSTGNNAINGGAFANLSGIPVVIQNTGANVLIQNAVILNLQIN